jgi:hypothetical protein
MPRPLRVALACVACLAFAEAAPAATSISDYFTRTSPGESLTAPFTDTDGVATANSYSGFVEVLVSGTGNSFASFTNDAFYILEFNAAQEFFWHLGIGTAAEPLAPFNPFRGAQRLITFIDGVGFVPQNTIPAFDPTNSYHFVINAGVDATPLSFGVIDEVFTDNGGAFAVQAWQLSDPIPEPATWLMTIFGFGAIGAAMRARRRRLMQAA